MNPKDRGLKKWHGFFMPEHTREIKTIWHEDKKTKMPVLDEYQLQEFEETLHYAIKYQLQVELEIYENGFIEKKQGFVHSLNQLQREIRLTNFNSQVKIIKFDEIVNIKTTN